MASVVDICNKALSLLGQKTIVSLTDDSPEAYACSTHWTPLRDEILRSHPWNCVTKRARLNRLLDAPAFEFRYQYQLPSKCLMVLELFDGSFFKVEGRKLLTDSETVDIRYIEATDDSTVYDSQLSAAFSFLLASELAYQMTSSNGLAGELHQRGMDKLQDAKASDAMEGLEPNRTGRRWLSSKFGR